MEKIADDFKSKGVEYYNLYTREPHPGEDRSNKRDGSVDARYDFSSVKNTQTLEEREIYALKMLADFGQKRPILIDIFPDREKGIKPVQQWLGGGAPNSLIVIDRDGKMVLWQDWSDIDGLRTKLDEMTK
ncbi:hypothetical protein ACFL7D_12150 [candidate division KSB1 bacterium]